MNPGHPPAIEGIFAASVDETKPLKHAIFNKKMEYEAAPTVMPEGQKTSNAASDMGAHGGFCRLIFRGR